MWNVDKEFLNSTLKGKNKRNTTDKRIEPYYQLLFDIEKHFKK